MKKAVDRDELFQYLKEHTRNEAAEYFNVKTYVIDNCIKIYNYKRETAEDKLNYFREVLPKEKLYELYKLQKKSYTEIVNLYHIPGDYLDSLLKEYRLGKRSITEQLYNSYTKEELEKLFFDQNLSISELSERLGTGYLNIRKLFKRLGIQNKPKELVQQNIEKTMVSKYGTKNIRQSEYFKLKSEQTKEERYGDPHYHNVEQMNKTISEKGKFYTATDSGPNKVFASLLKKNNISFRREFALGKYRYDFKVGNVLIEINPYATHNSTWGICGGIGKDPRYHVEKSILARENGYQCIHVWDWDDTSKIIKMLLPKQRIFARKCKIQEISQYDTNRFLKEVHLQGGAKMQTVCVALIYEDEIVQVMTFGKPRFNKNYEWELIRLCTKTGYLVVGGSERLYHYFLEKYNPVSIISYCDMSKFKGNVYTTLGMETLSINNPSRHWYNPETGRQLTDNGVRMLGFDKLCNANFGKGTSNDELLREHGWVEIWDAGQAVFSYIKP